MNNRSRCSMLSFIKLVLNHNLTEYLQYMHPCNIWGERDYLSLAQGFSRPSPLQTSWPNLLSAFPSYCIRPRRLRFPIFIETFGVGDSISSTLCSGLHQCYQCMIHEVNYVDGQKRNISSEELADMTSWARRESST